MATQVWVAVQVWVAGTGQVRSVHRFRGILVCAPEQFTPSAGMRGVQSDAIGLTN